eukprot:gene49784-biopygen52345
MRVPRPPAPPLRAHRATMLEDGGGAGAAAGARWPYGGHTRQDPLRVLLPVVKRRPSQESDPAESVSLAPDAASAPTLSPKGRDGGGTGAPEDGLSVEVRDHSPSAPKGLICPSPSTSASRIISSTSSSVSFSPTRHTHHMRGAASPRLVITWRSSAAEMNPFPSLSNTRNASLTK